MRSTVFWCVIVAAFAAALAWGWSFDLRSIPPRPKDLTQTVDAAWYERLPLAPAEATKSFLDRVPPEMRAKGEAYSDSRLIAFALRVLTLIVATVFICATGFAAAMRRFATRIASRSIAVDAIVAIQYFVALYALSLPVEVYARFMRPHWFGFSSQPFGSWLVDDVANWAVLTAFYVVGILLIFRFLRRYPRSWAAGAALAYFVLRALYAFLMPDVIEPLTNEFRPLPESPQKQAIESLARANGIAHPNVVVSNASKQSRLLNAHVSGVGETTRITVDDTTLGSTSDPVLRAVIAHEIGHFVLAHTATAIVTGTLLAGLGFMFVAFGMAAVVRRYGARWKMEGAGDIATLPLLWGLFALWGFVSLPAATAISRVSERQADLFALNASQAPHGLAEFMIHDADTARQQPTAIEYALFYTHPSPAERIMSAMVWRAENRGSGSK